MNYPHLHLILNHMPIMFPIIGILVLLAGIFFKHEILRKAALWIFVLTGITAFAAGWAGAGAEEVVEQIPGVAHDRIETHESAAALFAILCYVLALLSGIALWAISRGKSFANTLVYVVLAYALALNYFAARAGTTGGEIRHEEIRPGYQLPAGQGGADDHDSD